MNVPYVVVGVILIIVSILIAIFGKKKPDELANAKKREMGQFTAADVAKHSSRDDLWLILRLDGKAKVYDVTSYVDEHPGGDAILTNAGGDSTDAFLGPQHPPRVMDLIDEFCIGALVS